MFWRILEIFSARSRPQTMDSLKGSVESQANVKIRSLPNSLMENLFSINDLWWFSTCWVPQIPWMIFPPNIFAPAKSTVGRRLSFESTYFFWSYCGWTKYRGFNHPKWCRISCINSMLVLGRVWTHRKKSWVFCPTSGEVESSESEAEVERRLPDGSWICTLYIGCVVVSNIFTPTWGRFPFWLIFFRWVETTN